MCKDGYHFGEGPGKPKVKDRYGIYCGTPMGLKEGPGRFMVKNHYGAPGRQSKKASRRTTENSTETDKTVRGDQDATKGVTIQVNNTVTTQAENLEKTYDQARKKDNLKEPQNNNRPRPPETASTLSNWSLSFMIATICFIATIDVLLISSHLNDQETIHVGISEPKPSLQTVSEVEGKFLEEMNLTMAFNQVIRPRENRWTE